MKKVTIVGVGMGNPETLTIAAFNKIKNSEILIGAPRLLNSFDTFAGEKYELIATDAIVSCIENTNFNDITVLMSGDTGFFSGCTKLVELLESKGFYVDIIPGISSLSYICSKIKMSYDDCFKLSLHGRNVNPIPYIQNYEKVFILTDKTNTAQSIATELLSVKNDGITMFVGENLSYPDEKITVGDSSTISKLAFSPLSVIFIVNKCVHDEDSFGLCDEMFDKTDSPMTKSEVRAVCLSKMRLKKDSIAYDIGSGTGSVTVEMARIAKYGQVFAIEKNEIAHDKTCKNIEKFDLSNVKLIKGLAPDALCNLPNPDCAFIGGSSSNLDEIVRVLLGKNGKIRIVITAITLETMSEALEIIKKYGLINTEITHISISKSKKLGRYNMMTGQNPIYVICAEGQI